MIRRSSAIWTTIADHLRRIRQAPTRPTAPPLQKPEPSPSQPERIVEGEVDRIVQEHFFCDSGYRGVMLEVGAAKPDYLSVGARFRSLGWRVLSIEPNPYFCELHRQLGSDIVECACGESDRDNVSFFVVQTNGIYHGGRVTNESFSSLGIRGRYAELMQTVGSSTREITVNVRRLDTILRENAPDIASVDLLCVDVEGWELEVLKGLSFDLFCPKILIIENLFEEEAYTAYLSEKGYKLWQRIEPNDIFVRADLLT